MMPVVALIGCFGPPTQCGNIINRGASYRSEQYQEFFQSVDLVDFDANMDASTCFLASRINPPSPSGPGQLSGYIAVYGPGTPRARQGLLASIEFTEEVIANFMDPFRGGAAPVTQIPPRENCVRSFPALTTLVRQSSTI